MVHDDRIHGLVFKYTSYCTGIRFEWQFSLAISNTIFYFIPSFEVHYTPVLRFAQATIVSTQALLS